MSASDTTIVEEHLEVASDDRAHVARAVFRLALPAIASSLLHTLVFIVDRAMLGRHGAASLASMQISGPVVWSTFSLLSAFSIGTVALVGRAVGGRDRALATAATRASLGLSIGAGALAAVLGLAALPAIPAVFPSAGADVHAAANAYLVVVMPGMIPLLVSITASAVLAAAGDTRTPFVIGVIGNAINVGINWLLIFGNLGAPELGAQGAAIGSLAAAIVQAVVLVAWLGREGAVAGWRGRGGEADAIRRIVRISIAGFAERIAQHVGYFGYVAVIGALGATAMAANQALISIEAICFMSADGFGIAAAAIVAQRLGARRPGEAVLGAQVATAMAVALLGACGVVFLLAPELLLRAFSDDDAIVRTGLPVMWVAAAAQPFMAVAVVLGESLRGAGDTRSALVVSLVGGLVVRVCATWWLALEMGLGLPGVWLGSTIDWIVRSVLYALIFLRGRWRVTEV